MRLTDDEGTFMALLLRVQPATGYQLSKIYAESPVSNFGISKGKIYPLIRRLKDRGLITVAAVDDDRRGTGLLSCTKSGREAVRAWVMDIRPNHVLPEDPLRTKVQSFDLLSPVEQIQWVQLARTMTDQKLQELEEYSREVTVPFKDLVHGNAEAALRNRAEWLEHISTRIGARFKTHD